MESFTSINVARWNESQRLYLHFFRVDIKDFHDSDSVREVVSSLRSNYQMPDFQIDVTYWACVGEQVQ